MNKQTHIILLIVLGVSISQCNSILYTVFPKIGQKQYDLFLSHRHKESITIAWYIYEISNIINRIIWCYAVVVLSRDYRRRLYYVGIIFMCYYFSNLLCYLWDRNTSVLTSVLVYGATFAGIMQFFLPKRKKYETINST